MDLYQDPVSFHGGHICRLSSFCHSLFGRTPRDIREWTQPPEFQYAIH